MKRVFMDSQCLIAANLPRDVNHARALAQLDAIESSGGTLVLTDAILIEFCNMLSRVSLRNQAMRVVRTLRENDAVEIIHVTKEILERAIALYETRDDKEWGLTDCISFRVMTERKVSDCLTADHHFEQAGFQAVFK